MSQSEEYEEPLISLDDIKKNYESNAIIASGQIATSKSNKEVTIVNGGTKEPELKRIFTGNDIYARDSIQTEESDDPTIGWELVDIILIKTHKRQHNPNENFQTFKVTAEYVDFDDENETIFDVEYKGWAFDEDGCCRILCATKDDIPINISFTTNTGEEIKIDPYEISEKADVDKAGSESRQNLKIQYKTDSYEFYQEQIKIYSSNTFPYEKACIFLLGAYHTDILYRGLENGEVKLPDTEYNKYEHSMQVYYCDVNKYVYGVSHETVRNSNVFNYEPELEKEGLYNEGEMRYPQFKSSQFRYQNITSKLWLARRYFQIKDVGLHGQDTEFNIFRTLCFCKYVEGENDVQSEIVLKFTAGLICIILQIFLTVGIVMEVINNWDVEKMFDTDDNHDMIITISFLVFTFISFLFANTVKKFWEWYENMNHVMAIAWYIKFCDFVSNILIGCIICVVSFFYLLQSEAISDVVLNSFALTFVIELDDLANMWEADEAVLLFVDYYMSTYYYWQAEVWMPSTRRRRIYIKPKLFFISIGLVLLSPLFIFAAIFGILYIVYSHIMQMKNGYPAINR